MKIIQILNIEDSIVGLGDDGNMYDYELTPYIIHGLKNRSWTWVARETAPHYKGKLLLEDEANRLALLTVGETLTLIDKNKHQFPIKKNEGFMVATFTSHGFEFKWEFNSELNPMLERWELSFASFTIKTPHEIRHYRASSKNDMWELVS